MATFECEICTQPYDLTGRMPLVLQCGHTFCSQCLQQMYPQGPVTCFKDRHTDQRCVSLLPRNFQVIDASRIDIASLLQGFSGISIGHALFVDERELQLLDAELGKGATGQVVEGNFRGKPVAVKVVDLSDAPRDVCQSLQREASVVLAVSGECRHTCQYKGAIIKGNKFCLIMTRYSKSVARIVAETKAGLELSRLIRYGSQVLSALHELHSQGVVMADVKPQNLLLEESLDELVVTDFGLSRIVSHTIGGYRPSHQGGTPNYMSPELFSIDDMGNPTPCTPAVDIWAWACTMIHMVTGKVPFSNLNDTQICMQVGVHKRAPPIPTTLPDALQLLLRQCLAVSAEQRPTAAQALQAMMSSNITEAAAGGPQDLEVIFVSSNPTLLIKRLTIPYQPDLQLRQLKHMVVQQCRPAISQGVALPTAAVDKLASCCYPDLLETYKDVRHGSKTLQQLGLTLGKVFVLGMDARTLSCADVKTGLVSSPPIPAIHQYARHGQELPLLLSVSLLHSDVNQLISASGCSVVDAALQNRHLSLAAKLLQLHGTDMNTRVLLNSLPAVFECLGDEQLRDEALQLISDVTLLMEQRVGSKQQAGSTSFYVTKPLVFQLCADLLRRLKSSGATPVVVAKWQTLEQLELAVELDPRYLTRNLKAIQNVHMMNLYPGNTSEGSLTLLHQACGFLSTSWEGIPPQDLATVQRAIELASDVDATQKHVFNAENHSLQDYENACCRQCLDQYGPASTGICMKFSNLYYTPLHMAVLHGCQYPSIRGLLQDALPFGGYGGSRYSSGDRGVPDCGDLVAAAAGWLPVARLLVAAGADVHRHDARGRTPVQLLTDAITTAEQWAIDPIATAAAERSITDGCAGLFGVLRDWQAVFKGN